VQSHGDRVAVAFSWSDKDGGRHHWAQALQLKNGKIIDMQDFANPRSAIASVRFRAAFG
jgi:hypothetical protein